MRKMGALPISFVTIIIIICANVPEREIDRDRQMDTQRDRETHKERQREAKRENITHAM